MVTFPTDNESYSPGNANGKRPSSSLVDAMGESKRTKPGTDENIDRQSPTSDREEPKLKSMIVLRACVSCRRLKMKCVIPELGPPCKRCVAANRECILFQKPNRDERSNSRKHKLLSHSLKQTEKTLDTLLKSMGYPRMMSGMVESMSHSPSSQAAQLETHALIATLSPSPRTTYLPSSSPSTSASPKLRSLPDNSPDSLALLVEASLANQRAQLILSSFSPHQDQENDEGVNLLDVQSLEQEGSKMFPNGPSCLGLEQVTASPNHNANSPPEVSFVEAVSDSHSSADPEAMLQDLTKCITKDEEYPVASGGFGDIWKCTYQSDRGAIKVAVKSLMMYASDQVGEGKKKKTKRIRRELRTCTILKHENILPVYGYTYGFGIFLAIVSPWAENGNLTIYLEREDATLTLIRRFQILRDITSGLEYLHANNVIHGDLTGPNVLIRGDGTACLADFGLSLLYSEDVGITEASWTSTFHANFRWLAPELLGQPETGLPVVRPSKCSDIYSFGGIMLQVLTSKMPYYYLGEVTVILCIGSRIKPLRSSYPAFSDKYWNFIEECWSTAIQDRPSAEKVAEMIKDELDALSRSNADS